MNTLFNEIDKTRLVVSLRRIKSLAIERITNILSDKSSFPDQKAEMLKSMVVFQHGYLAGYFCNEACLTFSTWQIRIIFDFIRQMSSPNECKENLNAFRAEVHEEIRRYKMFEAHHLDQGAYESEHGEEL
jgi:hypothetical protein